MNYNRVALYLRYSSNSQTEQSIEGQRRVCKQYCESKGYTIVNEYIDRATSASHDTQKRTNFLRMISDAQDGKFDIVVVYKLDRFSRQRYDSAIYKQKLKTANVRLESATEPLSNRPESILMESFLEGIAEYYSVELAQKVKRGINESVDKRLFLGGAVPFGFKVVDKRLVPDPIEADAVRKMYNMIIMGYSYKEISHWMFEQGFRNRNGKPYNASMLNRLFRSKRYCGYYVYKDVEIEDGLPVIVEKSTWERVQEVLNMNTKRRHDHTQYLLAGKVFCGHCGEHMNGEKGRSKNGDYYYYYKCRTVKKGGNCHKHTVPKDQLENFVVQKALENLTDEMTDKIVNLVMTEYHKGTLRDDPVIPLQEKSNEIQKQIDNVIRAIMNGVSNPLVNDKLNELQTQKEQIDNAIADAESNRLVLDEDIIRFYLFKLKQDAEKSDDMKRILIKSFVDKVILWDSPDDNDKTEIEIAYKFGYSTAYTCSPSIDYAPPYEYLANTYFC